MMAGQQDGCNNDLRPSVVGAFYCSPYFCCGVFFVVVDLFVVWILSCKLLQLQTNHLVSVFCIYPPPLLLCFIGMVIDIAIFGIILTIECTNSC
jgi:hypothetical protein